MSAAQANEQRSVVTQSMWEESSTCKRLYEHTMFMTTISYLGGIAGRLRSQRKGIVASGLLLKIRRFARG